MSGFMLYLAGTLLRGVLIFAGAVLMERFGSRLLARGGRLVYYYLLLAILVCPIPGIEYGAFAIPAARPEVQPLAEVVPAKSPAAAAVPVAKNHAVVEVAAPVAIAGPETASPAEAVATTPVKAPVSPLMVLFYLWLAGAGVFALAKLTANIVWHRRVGRLNVVTDARITAIFAELSSKTRAVRLLNSDPLDLGPCCFGLFRPSVLFPVSLAESVSDDQLRMLLAHELEHIRRRDMFQICFRELLKIPFYFNPFLWYVLRRLNCATELACDAAVVRTLQLEPERQRSYGKLLLNLATAPHAGLPVTAPGIRGGAGDLKLRLREVFSGSGLTWKRVAALALCAVATGAVCMLMPSCAVNEPVPEEITEHRVIEGEFTLTLELEVTIQELKDGVLREIKRPEQVKSHFQYLVAADSNGKVLPSASNIVFYSPWLGEKFPFKDPDNRYYAEKLGWTVFAIPDMGYTDARMILAGQDELTRLFNLEPRKLLMYGASSGATNSINASLLHPERFDAIAAHSSRRWYPNKKGFEKKDSVARLLSNNYYDGAGNEALMILTDLDKLGMEALHIDTPPNYKAINSTFFHRSPNSFTQSLFHQYFKDIVKLRDDNGGIVPPPDKWPVKVKNRNGRTIHLPGKNLAAVYRTLPNDLVGRNAATQPLYFPAVSGKPVGTVMFLADPDFKNPMKLLDTVFYLASTGNVDVYALESASPQQLLPAAVKCLDSLKSKQPVYVIGTGKAGIAAVCAAVDSKNSKIARVSTFATPRTAALDGRTIAGETAEKPAFPVVMYFDAVTASNESGDSLIAVNVDAPAGFAQKITGLFDQAVKQDEIAPVESKKPPVVNLVPKLSAEAKALKAKIVPSKPETVKAYLEVLKKRSAEAEKMQKAGIIDITDLYEFQADQVATELEFSTVLNPGKSGAELNSIQREIVQRMHQILEKHGQVLYTRYNAGESGDREKGRRLNERYHEAVEKLKELQPEAAVL